jgi:organic hydroperoxide reductase OsmC/OhrA
MLPEKSAFTCKIRWLGSDNQDYDTFDRRHRIVLPRGQELLVGAAHKVQDAAQTNPEELLAASVGCCMMITILAVFSRSKIPVLAYEDEPEALMEFVERRSRVTKVTLRPHITLEEMQDREKLDNLISKAHANCTITLSVKSEVVVEPVFVTAQA